MGAIINIFKANQLMLKKITLLVVFGICLTIGNVTDNKAADLSELLDIVSRVDTANFKEVMISLASTNNSNILINKQLFLINLQNLKQKSIGSTVRNINLLKTISKQKLNKSKPPPRKKVFRKNTAPGQSLLFEQASPLIAIVQRSAEYTQKTSSTLWEGFKWEKWEKKNNEAAIPRITPYMSGFGEIKLYSLKLDGQNQAGAKKDSVYLAISKKIKESEFQIESRFNLLLRAQINKDAEVNFNIIQEPNMPQKTDVSLRIRQTRVNFGNINKTYKVGYFTNISKRIDGISVIGTEGRFSYNLGFGQAKSKKDSFSLVGNGKTEYPLRNKPILEKSLKVWVNDTFLTEKIHYQVNYFEGTVIFTEPKTNLDRIHFEYEYTNPIEEFIPIASNVNFLGLSAEYSNTSKQRVIQQYQKHKEIHKLKSNNQMIQLGNAPIKFASEIIKIGDLELIYNQDYYLHYENGLLSFINPLNTTINISYLVPKTISRTEVFRGSNKQIIYYLKATPLLENSEQIIAQGITYKKDIDYKIDYKNGRIFFLYPISKSSKITVTYKEKIFYTYSTKGEKDDAYSVKFGYFKEFAKAQKDLNTKQVAETYYPPTASSTTVIQLNNWPVITNSMVIYYDQVLVSSANYEIDLYRGTLTLNHSVTTRDILTNYTYYKEYGPSQWFFSGADSDLSSVEPITATLTARTIISNLEHPAKFDRYHNLINVEYKDQPSDYFQTLEYGKDYSIEFVDDGVKNGQIKLFLYTPHDINGVDYGRDISIINQLKVRYQYNKSNIPDPGNISNEQFEFIYKQTLSKHLNVELDIAKTVKAYSRSYQTTENTIQTTGEYGKTYTLPNSNIVENSETLYVNEKTIAIKNEDYYINYASGKLTFINLNPSASDNVKIEYDYYTTASGENLQNIVKTGTAVKLKSNYKNSFSDTKLELLTIEDGFSPMGTTKYAAGSNILKISSILKPNSNLSIATSFFRNNRKLTETNLSGKYLTQKEEKMVIDTQYTPLKNLQLNYKWEKNDNVSDINDTPSPNRRTVDHITYKNVLSLSAGPSNFKTSIFYSNSDYRNDYLDLINARYKTADTWQIKNRLTLLNNKFTLESNLAHTVELEQEPLSVNHKLNETTLDKTAFKFAYKPLSFIRIIGSYSQELSNKISSFNLSNEPVTSNQNKSQLENKSINISLTPPIRYFLFDNPRYQYFFNQSEKASLLLDQKSDRNNNYSNRVSWKFLGITTLSLGNSQAKSLASNDNIRKESHSTEYSIGGFSLMNKHAPLQIKTISRKFNESLNINNIPKSATLYTIARNYTSSSKYGITWKPLKNLNLDIDYSANTNFSRSTENKTTEIIRSFQTYPKENLRTNINFNIENLFKTSYNLNYELQGNSKLTDYLSTANVASINQSTVYNKTTNKIIQNINNVLFPGTQPIKINLSFSYDDYNDSTAGKGLKIRNINKYDATSTYTLFGFELSPIIKYSETLQWRRTSGDIALSSLKNNYFTYINNNTAEFSLNTAKKLNDKFSLLLNYSYTHINEDYLPSPNLKSISVHSLGIGIKTTPIPNLDARYTLTNKSNIQHHKNSIAQTSWAHIIKIEYTPIKTKTSKYTSSLSVIFNAHYNVGNGLNEFAKRETDQSDDETIVTEVIPIENLTVGGKLLARVEIPMAQRSHGTIEKFIFTAEGNIVIKDDYTNKALGYSIISFIFSGKLIF